MDYSTYLRGPRATLIQTRTLPFGERLRNEGPIEGEADKADRAQHRSIASVETSKRPRRSYARQDQGRRTRRPYRLRKQLPEPVFGQIKQARGFRQFLLRGFEKVCAEWALVCTPQSSQAR